VTDALHASTTPSARIRAAGIDHRADGGSARHADKALLARTNATTLDTTHFDTVRFPPPDWAVERFAAAARDGARPTRRTAAAWRSGAVSPHR
jgi:hypothetical protein